MAGTVLDDRPRPHNLVAVALVGLVVSLVFERSGGDATAVPLAPAQQGGPLHSASIDAFRAGMVVTAAFAFAGAAVAFCWISNEDARAGKSPPQEAVAHAI